MFFNLVFTAHLTLKENICNENMFMKSMVKKMFEKFKNYWSEYNRILAIIVILDPKHKLKVL